MAYFDKVVRLGETLRHSGELHWIIYVPGALLILIGLLCAITLPIVTVLLVSFGFASLLINWIKKRTDRKSTRLNSSHPSKSRMPSSA